MPKPGKYACLFCVSCCTSYSHLEEHMHKHTTERPYNCDHCSASFSYSGVLAIHKRNLHEGVKFECDRCGLLISCKSNLYTHKKKIHGVGFNGNVRNQNLKRERNRQILRRRNRMAQRKTCEIVTGNHEDIEVKEETPKLEVPQLQLDQLMVELGLEPFSNMIQEDDTEPSLNIEEEMPLEEIIPTELPKIQDILPELPKIELVQLPWDDPRVILNASKVTPRLGELTIHDMPNPPANIFFKVDGVIASPLPTLDQLRKNVDPQPLLRSPSPSRFIPKTQYSTLTEATMTPQRPAIHSCPICPRKFPFRTHLEVHVRARHDNGKTYSCQYCKTGFQYWSSLRRHVAKRCRVRQLLSLKTDNSGEDQSTVAVTGMTNQPEQRTQ